MPIVIEAWKESEGRPAVSSEEICGFSAYLGPSSDLYREQFPVAEHLSIWRINQTLLSLVCSFMP